jgi:hypothetical protein
MPAGWDQSGFDNALKELIKTCEVSKWPRALNKHGFFVTLAALQETERASPEKIFKELGREINAKRENGTSGPLPISIAIAAKRASKSWTKQGDISGHSKSQKAKELRKLSLVAWRNQIAKKLKSMLGGRAASTSFIKAGYVNIIKQLGPLIGGRYDRSGGRGIPVRGSSKGRVDPATPGKLQLVIENSAAAKTEHHGGFHKVADPAFQRALNREANQIIKHLEDEMRPEVDHFNRRQH